MDDTREMDQPDLVTQVSAFVETYIDQAEILADTLAIPPARLEALYQDGYDAYRRGDFQEAGEIFLGLVAFNHTDRRFHFALGSALQQLESYGEALCSYFIAQALDISDAGCSYRIGQCHWALGKREQAVAALQLAIAQSYGHAEYGHVADLAQKQLDLIVA